MKKILYLLMIIFSTNVFADYAAIVSKETGDFIEISPWKEWVDGEPYNCSEWLPATNEYSKIVDFEQTRTCYKDITRERFDKKDTELKTTTITQNQMNTGTKVLDLKVRSCGYDDTLAGNCSGSFINVNGVSRSIGRGWGIMTIDPKTFLMKSYAGFDTHADISRSNTMATYLNNLSDGDLVVIATYDQPAYFYNTFKTSVVNNLSGSSTLLSSIQLTDTTVASGDKYRSSYIIVAYKKGIKLGEVRNYRYSSSRLNLIIE